jgi:hypothetical protein
LETFGPSSDFKFNCLAFVQRLVPVALNGGEVHEYIFAGLALYESEALAGVKPLYGSLFFHGSSSSVVKLFGALVQVCGASSRNKKRPRVVQTRSPFDALSKGFTRAANAAKD